MPGQKGCIVLTDLFFNVRWTTPCKVEQPVRGMELQKKEVQKY